MERAKASEPGENTTGHYFVNTLLYTILMVFS